MKPLYKIWTAYILIIIFMIIAGTSFGQLVVTHFNAEWNNPNKAEFVGDLKDCVITYVDIAKSPKIQEKHNVIVVPTIIIFNNGKEVKRFQADLSFKITATREDIQEEIDKLIMNKF